MNLRIENMGKLAKAGIPVRNAMELQKIARQLHRLGEISCNYGLTERQNKREDRLVEKAQGIAAECGRKAYYQSDPRGWPLYIYTDDILGEYTIDAVYDRGLAVCPH